MSTGDILIVEPKNISVQTFQVAAGSDSTIQPGEPVVATPGTATVALAADATPSVGTDYLIGIAANDSSDTTSAAGTVDVYVLRGGEVLSMKAKVAANADTLAEIKALANDFLLMDLTSTVWTLDTAGGHVAANGLIATGEGEPENSRVYVRVRAAATLVGSDIAA
jgi:hypothetical protein